MFLLLKKKYLTPENTKSGFLLTKASRSFSELISVIETSLYRLDKILRIFFSSITIPTLSWWEFFGPRLGTTTISIVLLIFIEIILFFF